MTKTPKHIADRLPELHPDNPLRQRIDPTFVTGTDENDWSNAPGLSPSPIAQFMAERHDPDVSTPECGFLWEETIHHFKREDDGTETPFPHAQQLNLRGSIACRMPRIWPRLVKNISFTDLTPFTQGYVHALLADTAYFFPYVREVNYAAIHPPTLLRIIRDCERADTRTPFDPERAAYMGMCFWVDQLNGELAPRFPALEPIYSKGRIIFGFKLSALVAKLG